MPSPLVLVTGFGPFENVRENPSRAIAFALESAPPDGLRVAAGELPVSFRRSPQAFDGLLEGVGGAALAALVALGVQSKGSGFRLERRARTRLDAARPDGDGEPGAGVLEDGPERTTGLGLEDLAGRMRAAGGDPVTVSDDAGGYVCERVYHHLLGRAAERGVPGLFVHVPRLEEVSLERQVDVVRALLIGLRESLPAAR